jgi:hypothetical protein
VAPVPAGPPTQFDGACAPSNWDNAKIGNLVGLGAAPAKFYAKPAAWDHASGDDNTHYWRFEAMWVTSGKYAAGGGGACQLQGGNYVEGTLMLHYHPHAKPIQNYLHVKRTDGADAAVGAFKNNHWLVALIGLDAKTLTPDGK